MLDFESNLGNCDSKIQQYSNQLIKRNFTYCGVSYLFPPWLLACVLIDRTIFMSWNWKVPRQLTCSLVNHLNKLRLWSFLRLAENGCGYWKSDIWPKLEIWKSQFGFCDQSDRDREKEFPQTFECRKRSGIQVDKIEILCELCQFVALSSKCAVLTFLFQKELLCEEERIWGRSEAVESPRKVPVAQE